MSEVMDSGANSTARGFNPGASKYIRQHEPYPADGVTAIAPGAPEQGTIRMHWSSGLLPRREVALEGDHYTGSQRQSAMLEEHRLSDVDGFLPQIHIPETQAHDFSAAQAGAVGEHQHRE